MNYSKIPLSIRIIGLLLAVIALTWLGKWNKPVQQPVREHGVLGWFLPTENGLSALLIAPDDGIDTNETMTGLRLWLRPPESPEQLKKNFVLYAGPRMVVVGDSIPLHTLKQLGNTIDTGGVMWLVGKQLFQHDFLRQVLPHIDFSLQDPQEFFAPKESESSQTTYTKLDTQATKTIKLPAGTDTRMELVFSSPKTFRVEMESRSHRFLVADSISVLPEAMPGYLWSVAGVLRTPTTGMPDSISQREDFNTFTWSDSAAKVSAESADSTRIELGEPNLGAAFVEDVGYNRLLFKKMHLKEWNPKAQ